MNVGKSFIGNGSAIKVKNGTEIISSDIESCGYHATFRRILVLIVSVVVMLLSAGGSASAVITVDDSGGADFTSIQAAIDAANPGDEIHVYSGTYYENVNVNKQLTMRGIGMPVVDASNNGSAITLAADGIILEGFNATGAAISWAAGINVISNNNLLIDNNAYSNICYSDCYGILLQSSDNNMLIRNNASNSYIGIDLFSSNNNTMSGNTASNNVPGGDGGGLGILLQSSSNNTLTGNIMINNIHNFGVTGYTDSHYNNNVDAGNLVNGKPILYLRNVTDHVYNTSAIVGTLYCIHCNNITIRDSIFTNNLNGVFFWKTHNSKIENVDTSGNSRGIHLSSSSNNTLSNNNALHNGPVGGAYGIVLSSSNNNTLIGNNASNNIAGGSGGAFGFGISLSSSSNNTLIGNNASNNGNGWGDGIVLSSSSNNTLIGNNASNNENGILLYSSSINTLNGNTASNNGGYGGHGIFLSTSSNNLLVNNIMKGNKYNFGLGGSSSSDFNNQININNLVDGKPIYYIQGAADIVYDSYTNAGTFYCISCVNITIKDMNLNKNNVGVFFWNTTGSRIQNITALSNKYGIYLDSSGNNLLSSNTALNNNMGVRMDSSSNNLLSGSNTSNNNYGISLSYSSNNMLSGNNGNSNGIGFGYGISLRYSNNNSLTNNNASNNGLYGILLKYSGINTLIENNANSNHIDGILLEYSSNNKLIGNNAESNNARGIYLGYSSNNNTLSSNNATHNNNYGIYVYSSSNNLIYHNNFINNSQNAYDSSLNNFWDNDYPAGGNYWSDYISADNYSGPDQDQPGSDGIGDTPYNIDGGAGEQDRYPLINPWHAFGSISGIVTYSHDGTPISDATVELKKDGFIVAADNTASNGAYNFINILPASYELVFYKNPYYTRNIYNVEIEAGVSNVQNMDLRLAGDLDNNGQAGDAVDVNMIIQASVGDIPSHCYFDLDANGDCADAVDVNMMIQASVRDFTFSSVPSCLIDYTFLTGDTEGHN